MINDPTKCFACKVCGSIHLKADKITMPPSIVIFKNSIGGYLFSLHYCPDCINEAALLIATSLGDYPSHMENAIRFEKNKLHPLLIKSIEEFFKLFSYEFLTLEDAFKYIDKMKAGRKEFKIKAEEHLKTKFNLRSFLKSIFWIKTTKL